MTKDKLLKSDQKLNMNIMRIPKRMSKRIAMLMAMVLCASFLCGFSKTAPKLNTEETVIYEKIDVQDLYNAYIKDKANMKATYEGHDVYFSAIIKRLSDNGKSFFVCSPNGKNQVELTSSVKYTGIKIGDEVKCYGQVDLGLITSNLQIKLDHIVLSKGDVKKDFAFYQGNSYNKGDGVEVSIAKGKVKYRIPKEWKKVEKDGAIGIDTENGKYYMLNELKNRATTECFCIFYFDSPRYVAYDSDLTNRQGIEKSIITNIIPEEEDNLAWWNVSRGLIFPQESVKTGYGREFDYYTTLYKNQTVEFVFTPAGNGLCVMMYIYWDDVSSKEDILYLMRTMNL